MDKFEAIVIGAGPAGSTAAYLLAKAGVQVLLVERGSSPGSKNVSGALLFSRIVDEVFPEFWKEAPVERSVTGHGLVMLGADTAVTVDARAAGHEEIPNAFTVLRARLDPWLAGQAEEAGAVLVTGITVDELLLDNGWVAGIKAGPDELVADVVIDAEGGKSLLLERAGLKSPSRPGNLALGIKEIIELPEDVIEDRFNLRPGEGAALTLVGNTGGCAGGGFLYTNQASLSLGVVVRLDSLVEGKAHPHELMERYREHPYIARLISGSEIVEYSAQIVHEGVMESVPKLYHDGLLVVGSAGGLLVNNLLTFRGMDLAVGSAAAAAETVLEARTKGEFSDETLSGYQQRLRDSWILRDMQTFRRAPVLGNNSRLTQVYPEIAGQIMQEMFAVAPSPRKRMLAILRAALKKELVSVADALRDLVSLGRAI